MNRIGKRGRKWLQDILQGVGRRHEEERIGPDGQRYVLRYESAKLGPIDLGVSVRQRWFPLIDADTDRLGLCAAFGGWFGLHRFMMGETVSGVWYFLTCGCAGVLPAIDILQYITGTMSMMQDCYVEAGEVFTGDRERVYLTRPKHPRLMLLCVPAAFLTSYLVLRFLYFGLISWLIVQVGSMFAGVYGM